MAFSHEEQNNTLSLCMIVKNEAENLERCLNSVVSVIDELIIVDTGSHDRTLEVAEKFGARIFHHEWKDDFSEARNIALSHATCDWILVLDADEEVTEDTREQLKEAIQFENGIVNFLYIIESFNNNAILQSLQPRLFRNHKKIIYEHPVAETVIKSAFKVEVEENKKMRDFPVYINHFGVSDRDEAVRKIARNTQLLEKALSDISITPEERIYFILKLINSYRFLNSEPAKIISLIMHAYELMTKKQYREVKYDPETLIFNVYIIDYLIQIKNLPSAKQLITNALKFYPNSLNLLFMAFQLELETGKKEDALRRLAECRYYLERNLYYKYEPLLLTSIAVALNNFIQTFESQGTDLKALETEIEQELKKKQQVEAERKKKAFITKEEYEFTPVDPQKKLSLCLTVKDRPDLIERCLQNIYDLVDEIILIDAGKNDDETVEKASKYDCRIFSFDWKNDFSKLKNYALAQASGQWVLFLDINETIEKESFDELNKYLDNHKLSGVGTNILDYEKGQLQEIRREYRIFRNTPEIKFEGTVFESVKNSLEKYSEQNNMILLEDSDIVIKRFSEINPEELVLLDNLIDISLRKTASVTDKMFLYLKKAELSQRSSKDKEAVKMLIQSYDLFKSIDFSDSGKYPFVKDLYVSIIREMAKLKNFEVGKNVAVELVNIFPTEYRGYFYAGKFLFENKDFENARSALTEARSVLEYTYQFRFGRPLYAEEDAAEIERLLAAISGQEEKASNTEKISFYVITKNEEKYIERCLNSVKNLVDEIIVVDTGSDDKTKEIVREFVEACHGISLQAKLYEIPWEDDFAKARNEAMKQCSYPWIFTLDADEELLPVSENDFRTLTTDKSIIAYTATREDIAESEEEEPQLSGLYRLFQNKPEISYKLPIFESIYDSVLEMVNTGNYQVKKSNLHIRHYGYTAEAKKLHDTTARNNRIINKVLQNDELELKDRLLLITKQALFNQDNPDKYHEALQEALSLTENIGNVQKAEYPVIVELYDSLSNYCRQQEEYDKALEYCVQGLEIFPKAPTLQYKKALLLYLKKDYEHSIESFHDCLALGRNKDFYSQVPFKKGILSYISLFGIGSCYVNMEKFDLARIFFEQSLEENPGYKPAQNALDMIKDKSYG